MPPVNLITNAVDTSSINQDRRQHMPFRSKSQMRYMYAKHTKIAKKWSSKYGTPKDLPEKRTYLHGSGTLTGTACLKKVGAL